MNIEIATALYWRPSLYTGSKQSRPRVYTVPACPKCDTLKGWLKERAIEYEEKAFDTEAQLGFIMRNMFGNPPILEIGEEVYLSEDLFEHEVLDEVKLSEVFKSAEA